MVIQHLYSKTAAISLALMAVSAAAQQPAAPNTLPPASDPPAGDAGRYYLPGASVGGDAITPASFSQQYRVGANFQLGWNLSCGGLSFHQNIDQEIKNLQYKLKNTVQTAKDKAIVAAEGAVSNYVVYTLMQNNPTLGQLASKAFDEQLELFDVQVKECEDYEKDVKNGKNPLGEIMQVAIGQQWKKNIGLVNNGDAALEQAEKETYKKAQENGVEMGDGKSYGGKDQPPINIVQMLIKAGMNMNLGRTNKKEWDKPFPASDADIAKNPILAEFKSPDELYNFVKDIYGSTETRLDGGAKNGEATVTVPGRGYEVVYTEYRNSYLKSLTNYVNSAITRKQFETETRDVIPPSEIDDLRRMPPYERSVELEARAQLFAIKRLRRNLIFAKQALKTGLYAPDLQQSGMKGPSTEEYKNIYYRMLDDITEIGQRAYQF